MARIVVVEESRTGRNEVFKDNKTGREMSRLEFAQRIEKGDYPNYHVRLVNGLKTPVSNPDETEANNLD